MKIKVVIVCADSSLRSEIAEYINTGSYIMKVDSEYESTYSALCAFEEVRPSLVVIAGISNGENLQKFIHKVRAIVTDCRFLVMGARDDSRLMYALFQERGISYIGIPINETELSTHFERLSCEIRRVTLDAIIYDSQVSMQSLYLWKSMFDDSTIARSREFVNNISGIHFREGLYRVVLIRLEPVLGQIPNVEGAQYYLDINHIQRKIKAESNQLLYEYCYDMLFDFRFNGVLTVLNYAEEYDARVCECLEQIRLRSSEYSIRYYSMNLTVCVGSAYAEFDQVRLSREEAYYMSWLRLRKGTGKVLFYNKQFDMLEGYKNKFNKLMEELNLTARTLNVEEFHRLLHEIFDLPDYVLTDNHALKKLLGFVDYFFEQNADALSTHLNIPAQRDLVTKELNFPQSLDDFHKAFLRYFDNLFQMLGDDMEKQTARPLRKAVLYIREHYAEPLSAEILAEIVNLNPVYFSRLFKKQTGINMADYIANYRVEIAKNLLFETDMSIAQIASAVGFQDQRYFSRRFRSLTGMTPRDFRDQR